MADMIRCIASAKNKCIDLEFRNSDDLHEFLHERHEPSLQRVV